MTQEEKTKTINEKAARINELKRSLDSTDYIVTRAIEQNIEIQPEFRTMRQSWRDEINTLEIEIGELETVEPDPESII